MDGRQTAEESDVICTRISLVEGLQCVIGRRLHLLVGYRLHCRLHKLNILLLPLFIVCCLIIISWIQNHNLGAQKMYVNASRQQMHVNAAQKFLDDNKNACVVGDKTKDAGLRWIEKTEDEDGRPAEPIQICADRLLDASYQTLHHCLDVCDRMEELRQVRCVAVCLY